MNVASQENLSDLQLEVMDLHWRKRQRTGYSLEIPGGQFSASSVLRILSSVLLSQGF